MFCEKKQLMHHLCAALVPLVASFAAFLFSPELMACHCFSYVSFRCRCDHPCAPLPPALPAGCYLLQIMGDSEPIIVCRSALHVVTPPPETWYKDEGGKNNRITIEVLVRSAIPVLLFVVAVCWWRQLVVMAFDKRLWLLLWLVSC